MKRFISILLTLVLFSVATGMASTLQNEKLHYVITYKWGLIHKDAGEATLSLRNDNSNYSIMLSAKTKPWADRFYQVRDTLKGKIRISDFRPLTYTKIAHEKGKYGKDVIKYTYTGNVATGHCTRYKEKDGKVSSSEKTLTASGEVFDMLSIFYYIRKIDYARLSTGEKVKATVFSGSKSETITIRSVGKEKIKMRDKTEREAYHIKFNFTMGGNAKSSDDIDTWISTDSSHIPLYLVGTLAVGQVRAYYIP